MGDYYPITLNGTIYDYAASANKTLSNAVFIMEVAAINPYYRYGDSGELTTGKPHLLLVSRDCTPWALQYRSANTTWYDSTAINPWIGSHLYQTLNNTSNGLCSRVIASELGSYVYTGENNKGMRHNVENKVSGALDNTTRTWVDRGVLFLPSETEVWGHNTESSDLYGSGGGLLQWDIFAKSRRHLIKGLGNGGSRIGWWTESSKGGSNNSMCLIWNLGHTGNAMSANGGVAVPICFIFV